jgi:pyruvate dehydrogenase E2 component (dihydrolipoamide acetyltransferase)
VTVSKVVLAKLSPTMEEGTIVKWTKNEGDPVKTGDVLAEIETDKANMEMEALGSGVLRKILVAAGGKAPIGTLIGVIAEPDEDIAPLIAKETGGAAKPAAAKPGAAKPAAASTGGAPDAAAAQASAPKGAPSAPAASPAAAGAEAVAKAAPADQSASVASSAQTPAVPSAPPPAAAPAGAAGGGGTGSGGEGGRVKASPLARSMAAHRKIDLSSVPGSGPGGRIIKRDIESWAGPRPGAGAVSRDSGAAAPRPAPSRPGPPAPTITAGQELPLSNMRKTIAKRLVESKFSAPHYYVTVEIDMDAAVDLREQLQRLEEAKVSFNDLVVKACAKALKSFPMVNASWGGDKIVTHADVSVGIAVALPDGLITPVVRNADGKSVLEIAREVRDLATRARDRKLKPEEFTGSTFTISNLGMYDVTEFTAIINPPDSAILAVGAVRRVPVVDGDQIRPGHRMKVTMSSDHRVIDGALAAQFLAEVRRLLEAPVGLLL